MSYLTPKFDTNNFQLLGFKKLFLLNNHFFAQLCGIKYSYVIFQADLFNL